MIRKTLKLPVILTLMFMALMFLLSLTDPESIYIIPQHDIISIIIYTSGIIIIAIGGQLFRKENTTVNPMTPEKTTQLVTSGIYRYSRNPMYIGFFFWLLATAVFTGHIINLILLPLYIILVNKLYITPEEDALMKIFGDDFMKYKNQVRRWI